MIRASRAALARLRINAHTASDFLVVTFGSLLPPSALVGFGCHLHVKTIKNAQAHKFANLRANAAENAANVLAVTFSVASFATVFVLSSCISLEVTSNNQR